MLSALRQAAAKTRMVFKRCLSSSTAAANEVTNHLASTNGIVDLESLPIAAAAQPILLSSTRLRKPAKPLPPPVVRIPPPNDPLLEFITNFLMKHGHKQKAARITTRTLMYLHTLTRAPPLPIMREAIRHASPALRNISQVEGAKKYIFPQPLSEKQRVWRAMAWITEASKVRSGQELAERMAREMIVLVETMGSSAEKMREASLVYKWREEAHKVGVANRGAVFRRR